MGRDYPDCGAPCGVKSVFQGNSRAHPYYDCYRAPARIPRTRYSEPQRMAVPLRTMADANYFHMPLFKAGTVVQWGSKSETISHIVVRRSLLLVHLVGMDAPVNSDTLILAPTRFILTRVV